MPYEFISATNGKALSLFLLTGSLRLPVTISSWARGPPPRRGPTTQFPLANGGRIAAGKSEGGGAADDIYFPNQSNDEAAVVAFPLSRFARRHGQFINDSPSVEARHSSYLEELSIQKDIEQPA